VISLKKIVRLIGFALAFGIASVCVSVWASETLREASERVARQHDARVVAARTIETSDGRRIHVIRIVTREGVVRTIRVPVEPRGRSHAHSGG